MTPPGKSPMQRSPGPDPAIAMAERRQRVEKLLTRADQAQYEGDGTLAILCRTNALCINQGLAVAPDPELEDA